MAYYRVEVVAELVTNQSYRRSGALGNSVDDKGSVLMEHKVNAGVEIQHYGDLPARSGLGSSSTFTVWEN
jgi:galactokinase/mevalonate kinase-like predicted kinase